MSPSWNGPDISDFRPVLLCWPQAQRDAPNGGTPTLSIFQIPPPSVTTYAVLPMNSSEVGRSNGANTSVKVPSLLTLTSAPVSGSAGEPSG